MTIATKRIFGLATAGAAALAILAPTALAGGDGHKPKPPPKKPKIEQVQVSAHAVCVDLKNKHGQVYRRVVQVDGSAHNPNMGKRAPSASVTMSALHVTDGPKLVSPKGTAQFTTGATRFGRAKGVATFEVVLQRPDGKVSDHAKRMYTIEVPFDVACKQPPRIKVTGGRADKYIPRFTTPNRYFRARMSASYRVNIGAKYKSRVRADVQIIDIMGKGLVAKNGARVISRTFRNVTPYTKVEWNPLFRTTWYALNRTVCNRMFVRVRLKGEKVWRTVAKDRACSYDPYEIPAHRR